MIRRSHLLALALFCVLTAPARAVTAAFAAESVEWAVFDSAVIVRGEVESTRPVDGAAGPPWAVTVTVDEVIKGSAGASVTFVADADSRAVALWALGPHLFFLVANPNVAGAAAVPGSATTRPADPLAAHAYAHRRSPPGFPVPLSPSLHRRVFDAEGRELETPEDVLAVVRREAGHPPARQAGPLELRVHGEFLRFLIVLVDDRAEARAREWVRADDPVDRWDGAAVLGRFRSDENVKELTRLLDDPFATTTPRWPRNSKTSWSSYARDFGYGRFPLRKAAYDALKAWGVAPPEVVLYETARPQTYLPRWALGAMVGGVLAALAVAAAIALRARRRFGAIATFSALLLVPSVAAYVRGRTHVDRLTFRPHPAAQYEVTSGDGGVRVTRVAVADEPTPVAYVGARREQWDKILRPPPPGAAMVMNCCPASGGALGFVADSGNVVVGEAVCPYRSYTAPHWAFVAAFGLPSAAKVLRAVGGRRRRRRGDPNACPVCGYDCRATPERCPECGATAGA